MEKQNKLIFRGKVSEITEVKSGTTQKGNEWSSIDVEVTESNPLNPDFPQIGNFSYFKQGEYKKMVDEFKFKVGDEVEVDFNLKRQLYTKDGVQKKFFKQEAWTINGVEGGSAPQQKQNAFEPQGTDIDLPF